MVWQLILAVETVWPMDLNAPLANTAVAVMLLLPPSLKYY
jgi:hypothetical protein